jgi:hypothetical protein
MGELIELTTKTTKTTKESRSQPTPFFVVFLSSWLNPSLKEFP